MGKSVEPLPQNGLGSYDLAASLHDCRVPCESLGVIVIPSAGKCDPEGGVGEIGGHYLCPSERPYR